MRLVRPLSLRTRLAVIAGLGAMVLLGVGALVLYRDLSGELSDAITDELAIRVSDLATSLENGTGAPAAGLVIAQAVGPDGTVLSPAGAERVLSPAELARALEAPIIINRAVPGIGAHARLLARRVDRDGATTPVVGVAAVSTEALEHARDRLTGVLGVAGPALATAIAAAAWLLAGAALRPVRRMTDEAATISMAAPGRRLAQPAGDDEIAQLGRTLNAMLDRIEATVAHERAFVDDAAHELRTPLAVLRGELELAAQDPGDQPAVRQGLASALEEADRLTRLTQDLLTLARADAGQIVPGDASVDVLGVAQAVVERLPRRPGIKVRVAGEPVFVRGEPYLIEHIVTNLVANADRYAGSLIVVSTEPAGTYGRLLVADDGPGFPVELLPRVFERFARADGARGRAGGGAGLGLAITASVANALGGRVSAANGPPLGGARVTVELPAADA